MIVARCATLRQPGQTHTNYSATHPYWFLSTSIERIRTEIIQKQKCIYNTQLQIGFGPILLHHLIESTSKSPQTAPNSVENHAEKLNSVSSHSFFILWLFAHRALYTRIASLPLLSRALHRTRRKHTFVCDFRSIRVRRNFDFSFQEHINHRHTEITESTVMCLLTGTKLMFLLLRLQLNRLCVIAFLSVVSYFFPFHFRLNSAAFRHLSIYISLYTLTLWAANTFLSWHIRTLHKWDGRHRIPFWISKISTATATTTKMNYHH